MADRTVTGAIESEAAPETILSILEDAANLPKWAPAFADRLEPVGDGRWTVTRGETTFQIEVVIGWTRRTVDYLREVAPGQRGGAYLRVLPRPGGGSVVVMTLPVPPDGDAEQGRVVMQQELAALIRLSTA